MRTILARYAALEGGLEPPAMGSFVDRILGGDMTFKRIKELPELIPPYLMDADDDGGGEAAEATQKTEL